ncbi:hypothetical protein ACFZBU_03145 [Embleya sp. NPDC008237]|uniref:hypothetical protein n=1 Tax=Embleya sp. NPDC008237 TaxID=3363978 RepID=UPI0036E3FB84
MSAPDAVDAYAAIHAARPGEVGAAADGWRLAAARLGELRDALAETGRRGAQIWTGGGAERFTARCQALADAADRLAAQGAALHEHLDEAARALRQAQERATDPTAAQAAAARLEGVYRDLGERLSGRPLPPRGDAASGATQPATTGGIPNPTHPCTAATASTTEPAAPVGPVDPASPEVVPTATDTPNRPSPESCEPPETPALPAPPAPAAPAVSPACDVLAVPEVPAPPPPSAPVATCMAATPPAPLPPDPPAAPAATALLPPPAVACAPSPAPPAPAVVGTPLSREPRRVQPAGIGPRVRRPAPPPSAPIAPVTGIRVAPGLRGDGGIGDHPAATHDAAHATHAAGPVPDLLGGAARDGASLTPMSPTWVTTPTTPTTPTAPTTGGAPTTPSTSTRPRPRPGSRYATHSAEAWWTDPQTPPHPT